MTNKQIILLLFVAALAGTAAFALGSGSSAKLPTSKLTSASTSVQSAFLHAEVRHPQSPAVQAAKPQPPASAPAGQSPLGGADTSTSTSGVARETVSLKIIDPDGTKMFDVTLREGDTLCDNLTEAKAEGKIRSLTVDDSYSSTFHSLYIREVDGYSNNWTVKVNGLEPEGCSLYRPQAGDVIVWTFGS